MECEANGFLKQQIRKANAVLVEIGRGKQLAELMEQVIDGVPGIPEIPLPARSRTCTCRSEIPGGSF